MAPRARALASLLVGVAATWTFSLRPAFCGNSAATRAATTARNGWRLDQIEVSPQGIGQLVIAEGFFIGEKAMFEAMSRNGRRYRMRATPQEMKAGGPDVPPITQIGPLKLRLFEAFGGSGAVPGIEKTKPAGYLGCAGAAGSLVGRELPEGLPIKGGWKVIEKK
ncbi:unnamed protein product [Polarella glacialis]|uniref:Uncharacterized protein n=1 Tax=Polarella glacialis TaxID=89957 RepID=A0A813L0C6_POLGL|nr:unnamed protein product [Polarella glacialis]